MRIAVIGGGFYGCVIALRLNQLGIHVDLFEKKPELLRGAIMANQHRLHLGFHYPRCDLTIGQAKDSFDEFCREYPSAVEDIAQNFYCVHSDGFVSGKEYADKMSEHGLPFSECPVPSFIKNKSDIELSVLVPEKMIRLSELRDRVLDQVGLSHVNVILGADRRPSQISDDYDFVINCTYTEPGEDVSLQTKSELAVMLLAETPRSWSGKAITIMDGPFCSIYPAGENLHTVSSVAYTPALKGASSRMLEKIATSLDKDDWNYIDSRILDHASGLVDTEGFKVVGRYTTIKTKMERDVNDFRGTAVFQEGNVIAVLPGKISCAFLAAREIIKKLGV